LVIAAAFTTIAADQEYLQDKDIVNEIMTTWREHAAAIGGSTNDKGNIAVGHDVQAASFWAPIQGWAETNCVEFIDHDNTTLAGFADTNSASQKSVTNWLTMYTLISCRDAAGIHTNGFRRVTNGVAYDPDVNDWRDLDDPMYTYGFIQVGDILGPWVLDDLQKFFSVLQWTYDHNTGSGAVNAWSNMLCDGDSTISDGDAYTNAYNAWTNLITHDTWAGSGSGLTGLDEADFYSVQRLHDYDPPDPISATWTYQMEKSRSKPKITSIPEANIAADWELYAFPRRSDLASPNAYWDADSKGWTEGNSTLIENDTLAANCTAITGALIQSDNDFPPAMSPNWTPPPPFGNSNMVHGIQIEAGAGGDEWGLRGWYWIFKWDFTYEN
jgi:hypothetical protein